MNAIVIEHVPVADLPEQWRGRLDHLATVTVRIEVEPASGPTEVFTSDDPAFGIWRDRNDLDDVQAYLQRIRAPRFNRDGSRNDEP